MASETTVRLQGGIRTPVAAKGIEPHPVHQRAAGVGRDTSRTQVVTVEVGQGAVGGLAAGDGMEGSSCSDPSPSMAKRVTKELSPNSNLSRRPVPLLV